MAEPQKKPASSQVKIGATILIFVAITLTLWQLITPLPSFLQPVFAILQVVLVIHAVEGAIAAILIGLYKFRTSNPSETAQTENSLLMEKLPDNTILAIIKAGLYAFFVGTVGLVEIIQATKTSSEVSEA
ncbi:MAG: hypothetical protein ABG776_17940 [Cyanobacteria bacterium J06555_13]